MNLTNTRLMTLYIINGLITGLISNIKVKYYKSLLILQI